MNIQIMELYKLTYLRRLVVLLRAFIFVKVLKRLKIADSEDAFQITVKHNLKGLYQCNDRVNLLVLPLVSIEKINKDSKILIIGPRNEHDLYLLRAQGLKMKNIVGLDLISYSPYIKIGDMHQMEFENDTFDAVIFGWTLSYSSEPKKAIDEIIRVTKNGGLIAVGIEYSSLDNNVTEKLLGYNIQEFEKLGKRINSSDQILELFDDKIKHIYFNHDAPLKNHHTTEKFIKNVSNVAVIVEIKKNEQ